jgi:ribonuclease Z
MKVSILGNNSALAAFGRHTTSQVVQVDDETLCMIDCGEGVQEQIQRFGIRKNKIAYIFISHMHGDHYFGLPGLLNSMNLLGRTAPLTIFCPDELPAIMEAIFKAGDSHIQFPLTFCKLSEQDECLVNTNRFSVCSFPVEHRIPCYGFLVEQKSRARKINAAACESYQIPYSHYDALKEGADYIDEKGNTILNKWLTDEGTAPKKYAFCADTLFTTSFLEAITGCDTMYHESTYLDIDESKAAIRFHSTAKQAAQLAVLAKTKKLLLGHYSSKYRDVRVFEEEARSIFPNTFATIEGVTYEV